MAENLTPVQLEVGGFEVREVMLVDYKFNQEVDREGQISGIPRGGRITIRVKAMNDGNNQLLQWMLAPNDPRDVKLTFFNTIDGTVTVSRTGNGDVDGNGKINNRDFGYLKQYLNGWDNIQVDLSAADVDGDGRVTNRDLGYLQQIINGWDVNLG